MARTAVRMAVRFWWTKKFSCRLDSMLAKISACESLRGGLPAAKPIEPEQTELEL